MKRFITDDDLTVLVTKASTLRKLAKSAQKIHTDLAVEEGYVKAADRSIGRGHGLLQNRTLTPKQRAKIEQQLERDQHLVSAPNRSTGKRTRRFQGLWHR
jgi:hypothetical protein